jgi:hypothetical protein
MKKRLATLLALCAGAAGLVLPATASASYIATAASGVTINVGPCSLTPLKPGFSGTTAYFGEDVWCPSNNDYWRVYTSLQYWNGSSWATACYYNGYTLWYGTHNVIYSCGPEYPFMNWRTLVTIVVN